MTDESQRFEPDEQDAGSDPAQAFDALRRGRRNDRRLSSSG